MTTHKIQRDLEEIVDESDSRQADGKKRILLI
jgi:hypothetical protein